MTDSSALNNSSGPGCLKVRRSSAGAPRRGGIVIKYLSTCCTPNTLSKYTISFTKQHGFAPGGCGGDAALDDGRGAPGERECVCPYVDVRVL